MTIPYVRAVKDRYGAFRFYFERRGLRVRLHSEPGEPAFEASYQAALSGKPLPAPARRLPPAVINRPARYLTSRSGDPSAPRLVL